MVGIRAASRLVAWYSRLSRPVTQRLHKPRNTANSGWYQAQSDPGGLRPDMQGDCAPRIEALFFESVSSLQDNPVPRLARKHLGGSGS